MENFMIIRFVLLVGIAIVSCLCIAKVQNKHYFTCKHCGKEFRPRWKQLVFEIHVLDEHVIRCPYCNVKDYCKDKGKRK